MPPRTSDGDSALHTALRSRNEACVAELIESGASLDAIGARGEVPLYTAVASGLDSLVPRFLRTAARVEASEEDQEALLEAIVGGRILALTDLLQEGADPDALLGSLLQPALLVACARGEDQAVAQLVRYGADATAIHPEYGGVVGWSALNCSVVTLRLLLLRGASPTEEFNAFNWGTPQIPFVEAARNPDIGVLEVLLSTGIDIDVRWCGETALMRAASVDNARAVDFLIRNGADKDAQVGGWTPLYFAALLPGNLHATKMLIAHGANLDLADSSGRTPVAVARSNGHLELEKTLLAAGAADEYAVPAKLRTTEPTLEYDFFLSYRHRKYREDAKSLKQRLEALGCKVFLDVEATELAAANSGQTIDREELKTTLYQAVQSARYTLFFEAWDERQIDPKSGRSSDAFNWQRFERIYANGFISLQGEDIRDPQMLTGLVDRLRYARPQTSQPRLDLASVRAELDQVDVLLGRVRK